jgi:hypothetical protein
MTDPIDLPPGAHYAVAVPCGTCGARPGVRCISVHGHRQDRPHPSRLAAWRETATARDRLAAMVHTERTEGTGGYWEREVLAALDAFAAEVREATLTMAAQWLVKKAGEFRSVGRRRWPELPDALDTLASKVLRGAVRPDNLLTLGGEAVAAVPTGLTPEVRQLLAYACELVGDQIASTPADFTPEDAAALAELRQLADAGPAPTAGEPR